MKVLLLYASVGAGHKRAAESLKEAFKEHGISAELKDLLEFLPKPMGSFYSWAYSFMIQETRWLWRLVYELSEKPVSAYTPAKSFWQKWQFTGLLDYLRNENFTHILSTHFTPSALLTDWKDNGNLQSRIYSVVTDYIAHRCWKRSRLDHYFVATDEVAMQLSSAGIESARITVSGIPISVAFSHPTVRDEARASWGCDSGSTVILFFTSGLNTAKAKQLVREVASMNGAVRFLISAGENPTRESEIKALCEQDPRFTVFGFSKRVPELMKVADLLVSKPGGLSVSEALAMGTPLVLLSPIPGQEEANAEYTIRHGAGVSIEANSGVFKRTLEDLLMNQTRLSAMAQAAQRLGKPDAARTIVDHILSD